MFKKIFLVQFIAIVAVYITFDSCKKDDKIATVTIVGKWKMTAYLHNDVNVFGTGVPPCMTDNVLTFFSDHRIAQDEGPTKCNTTDPQIQTATYSFNSDSTQLIISFNGDSDSNNIITLNATTLKIEQVSNGDVITYTKIE